MTEFPDIPGGRIANGTRGTGALVLLAHGLGDMRQAYRFLAPQLTRAGYQPAAMDMRGHGESSTGRDSCSRAADIAATLPADATIAMIDGGGHHPHAQFPAQVAAAVPPFVVGHAEHRPADRRQP